ncbi:MAG TPA: hypothetical protein VEJ47_04935, partial [Candidatus Eremiobacteraceae bacterium]|nr:hypothetical protein [Candidatus Eremiobacteraceae bacterium]
CRIYRRVGKRQGKCGARQYARSDQRGNKLAARRVMLGVVVMRVMMMRVMMMRMAMTGAICHVCLGR